MRKNLLSTAGLAALAMFAFGFMPETASAVTFTCDAPNASDCNGNLYSVDVKSHVGNTWQLAVSVKVLDPAFTRLSAIGIKDMAGSISNTSLVSFPGGGDAFAFFAGELNNGGDICGNDNQPGTKMCAWAGDNKGVTASVGDVLTFVFQFDAASLFGTLHLKYQYIDSDGKKVGSLGSFDTGIDGGHPVSEPGTLALLGIGLVGLGLLRRRVR